MTVREILDKHPRMEAPLRAFYHALPGLLADPDAGPFAVVTADGIHGTWDTYRDAMQHGLELFGIEGFLAQKIDPRMMDLLAAAFGPLPTSEAATCPA